jgi:nitrogen fixation-related uncharacterized protein
MYQTLFIVYAVLIVAAAVLLFVWALGSGQFRDQRRARFLPLMGESPLKGAARSGTTRRAAFLYGIIGILAALVLVVGIFLAYAAFFA